MANHLSAKKRIRQSVTRTAVNRARRSEMRSQVRSVEQAIENGDKDAATAAMALAAPSLHRSTRKGLVHRNAAARKISRLTKSINAL
ncbi:MAG: 30S ribosomal protein S20 [Alphaproteobacteria bacterium]|nr:30S ribosomal protein S20 [Alphaproteobacteria bacterium]